MYFVVIMAFALVLSDQLPPASMNLFGSSPVWIWVVVVGQVVLAAAWAVSMRIRMGRRLDGTDAGHDDAVEVYGQGQLGLVVLLAACLGVTFVLTPWARLIRGTMLAGLPLVGDLTMIAPFFVSLMSAWVLVYPVEARLRGEALGAAPADARPRTATMVSYLFDKLRHQVLIVAVPMVVIVFAKHFTDMLKPRFRFGPFNWVPDSILGCVSFVVLLFAPLILSWIWDTQRLAAGPLRDRFERTCRRIGLRYRDILLWRTHGMTVNAAVMGFVPQLRYILVSDALLSTLDDEEIEAVFAHEAGHIHHWHLPCFGLFAIGSMYVSGAVLLLVDYSGVRCSIATLQLIGLTVLLAIWLLGFGWLSRRFERQADLFGVRCLGFDMNRCEAPGCGIHGEKPTGGLCLTAANVFGRTLAKIANLNGIPRHAPSWRHGSIESRCRLIAEFATDAGALRRFDRDLVRLKIGLLAAGGIGTLVMMMLYGRGVLTLF